MRGNLRCKAGFPLFLFTLSPCPHSITRHFTGVKRRIKGPLPSDPDAIMPHAALKCMNRYPKN